MAINKYSHNVSKVGHTDRTKPHPHLCRRRCNPHADTEGKAIMTQDFAPAYGAEYLKNGDSHGL